MPRSPYQKEIAKNQIHLSPEQEEKLFNYLIDKRNELRYLLLSQRLSAKYIADKFEEIANQNKSIAKLSQAFNSKKIGGNQQLRFNLKGTVNILRSAINAKDTEEIASVLSSCNLADAFVLYELPKNVVYPLEVKKEIVALHSYIHRLEEIAIRSALAAAYEVGSKYKSKSFDILIEDTTQDANLGLIEAVRLYRPGKGTRFITYAYSKCANAVKDSQMQNRRQVRLPRNRLDSIFAVSTGLKNTKGRITMERIKDETNKVLVTRGKSQLTKKEVEESLNNLDNSNIRIDQKASSASAEDSRSQTIGDLIQDPRLNPEESIEYKERFKDIEEMMQACDLNKFEKNMIRIRYLSENESITNKEASQAMQPPISRETARKFEQSAIVKLQQRAQEFKHLLKYMTREN